MVTDVGCGVRCPFADPQQVVELADLAREPAAAVVARELFVAHQRLDAPHHLGDLQQLLHAGEVDAQVFDQPLDEAQPFDLVERIQPHAADGARRPHQAQPFVLAQRLRVHAEHPRRGGDEDQLVGHTRGIDTHQVWALIRSVSMRGEGNPVEADAMLSRDESSSPSRPPARAASCCHHWPSSRRPWRRHHRPSRRCGRWRPVPGSRSRAATATRRR